VAKPDHRLSKVVNAHAIVMAGLSTAHSLRARGLRRTLLFAMLGHAIPVLGEHLAVNVLRVLRHRIEPRLKGVPLAVALGWYNVAYGTLAVMESILNRADLNQDQRSRTLLAPGTALVATSLDLLVDPFGLDLGLWEWSGDGAYATEIEGPNGKHGVPLLNFIGWLGLITSVTLAYQRLDPDDERIRPSQPGAADSPEVGRTAALLLLPYYLPALVWALNRRKPKHLLYSAPFSVAAWAALRGH
jgi:uncharacterized membrane protein